jgi:hypothetical protein
MITKHVGITFVELPKAEKIRKNKIWQVGNLSSN